jgi:hypothetical protein
MLQQPVLVDEPVPGELDLGDEFAVDDRQNASVRVAEFRVVGDGIQSTL